MNKTVYFADGFAEIWTDEAIGLELKNLSITQVIQIIALLKALNTAGAFPEKFFVAVL